MIAACGSGDNSGNTTAGPQVPSLQGERVGDVYEPAVDIKLAPTKLHGELAALLPKGALVKDSVIYGGWDAASATLSDETPESAAMPTVAASYRSMSHTITTDTENKASAIKQEYPQTARFILIKAPEVAAAQPVADAIRDNLLAKGFHELSPLELVIGIANSQPVLRYSRVDSRTDIDDVYVAYIKVVNDVVLFALESEAAAKVPGPDGAQISRVEDSGLGTRLGGQLTVLAADRLLRP
ncbi:MAG: hypothetical protein H6841_10935 [Planctomycetes bacterium]|nr:hypothetical protein [Planctomycetota bacterium]MCB9935804.1 hypothetical protein [Planctomycetota bacterium]